MIFLAGPGHGAPGVLGPGYLEGTYSEVYPEKSEDDEGLREFFKQFSFPGGIGSHCTPETPGSIHEGGELGYVLSHACGAAFDNPDLIVAAVVGDGESETGPLATSWHINKFLNPHARWRGAADPPSERLQDQQSHVAGAHLSMRNWRACFAAMAGRRTSSKAPTPTACIRRWRRPWSTASRRSASIQQRRARQRRDVTRPHWPMIVLRSPKGWTAPQEVEGHRLEGFWRAHQVPLPNVKKDPEQLRTAGRLDALAEAGRTVRRHTASSCRNSATWRPPVPGA